MRKTLIFAALSAGMAVASPALAEFSKVSNQQEFIALVKGKQLRRPLIKLEVSEDGQISGYGASWPVEGSWTWTDGYFCRDLFWDGDPLGYNCQKVEAKGNRIRFTSDKGAGETASFRLR
ncbi:MAG: dihydrodipicolinate reductase [Pseudomonadota bacterium]